MNHISEMSKSEKCELEFIDYEVWYLGSIIWCIIPTIVIMCSMVVIYRHVQKINRQNLDILVHLAYYNKLNHMGGQQTTETCFSQL